MEKYWWAAIHRFVSRHFFWIENKLGLLVNALSLRTRISDCTGIYIHRTTDLQVLLWTGSSFSLTKNDYELRFTHCHLRHECHLRFFICMCAISLRHSTSWSSSSFPNLWVHTPLSLCKFAFFSGLLIAINCVIAGLPWSAAHGGDNGSNCLLWGCLVVAIWHHRCCYTYCYIVRERRREEWLALLRRWREYWWISASRS